MLWLITGASMLILESPEVAESGKEELTSDQVKGAISFKHVSFGYHPEKILIKDFHSLIFQLVARWPSLVRQVLVNQPLSIFLCVSILLTQEISC